MNKLSLVFIAMISVMLTACGGSSDSGSESGNVSLDNAPNGGAFVSGEFKYASDTGKYFIDDAFAINSSSTECLSNNNYYFESANVLVYGSSSLADTDFQHAATLIENQLDNAFNAMGITKAQFDSYRPKYSPSTVGDMMNLFLMGHSVTENGTTVRYDITDIDSDFAQPSNWSSMSDTEQYTYVVAYWNASSEAKHDELFGLYLEVYPHFDEFAKYIEDKIVVCLNPSMGGSSYGEGSLVGMTLATKSSAERADDSQIVLHELIHTIQKNIAFPSVYSEVYIDRWFSEGQAVALAGQKVATSSNGAYTPQVKSITNEHDHFSSTGEAYEQYGFAYNYLADSNDSQAMIALLEGVRYYSLPNKYKSEQHVSSDAFRHGFDENMKKPNGSQLTLEEFETNYLSFH